MSLYRAYFVPGATDPTGMECELRSSDNANAIRKRVTGTFVAIGGFSGGEGLNPSPLNISSASHVRCRRADTRTVRYECCCDGKKSIHFET